MKKYILNYDDDEEYFVFDSLRDIKDIIEGSKDLKDVEYEEIYGFFRSQFCKPESCVLEIDIRAIPFRNTVEFEDE